MGVYIDMKMPKTCAGCEWSRYSFPVAWCGRTHHTVDIEIAKTGRPDDCPLIEVPEPHGDLIDAQEQMRLMQSYDYDTYDDYSRAFDMLDNAPTIIPASEEE